MGSVTGVFFLRTGEGDPPLGDADLRFEALPIFSNGFAMRQHVRHCAHQHTHHRLVERAVADARRHLIAVDPQAQVALGIEQTELEPNELIRAILVAGGTTLEVDRDLIVTDDLAIVVVPDPTDRASEALNHAFLRCQEARRPQGLVIRLGWVNAEELRHREAAAPWVRHVDSDAIQRMADAVAVGADPVAFASRPRVVET